MKNAEMTKKQLANTALKVITSQAARFNYKEPAILKVEHDENDSGRYSVRFYVHCRHLELFFNITSALNLTSIYYHHITPESEKQLTGRGDDMDKDYLNVGII